MSGDKTFAEEMADVNDESHAASPTPQRAKVPIQLSSQPTVQRGDLKRGA
jgi:hypothetical protein